MHSFRANVAKVARFSSHCTECTGAIKVGWPNPRDKGKMERQDTWPGSTGWGIRVKISEPSAVLITNHWPLKAVFWPSAANVPSAFSTFNLLWSSCPTLQPPHLSTEQWSPTAWPACATLCVCLMALQPRDSPPNGRSWNRTFVSYTDSRPPPPPTPLKPR